MQKINTYLTIATPTNLTGFIKGDGTILSADNSTYLTTIGTAADSAKLGAVAAAGYALLSGATLTGAVTIPILVETIRRPLTLFLRFIKMITLGGGAVYL